MANKYNLTAFNLVQARQGKLCAVVGNEVSASEPILSTASNFEGVGIVHEEDHIFHLVIDSVDYQFDERGQSYSQNTIGLKLMMAELQDKIVTEGNALETTQKNVTRSSDGNVTTTVGEATTILVDNLNARDQFAVQALKSLMEKSTKNPAELSNSEMNMYCQAAYKWAANMMAVAANARATISTEESSGEGSDTSPSSTNTTRSVTVSTEELTSASDKLLNNIVSIMERSETSETQGTGENAKTVYSERISIPKLVDWLDNYSRHTPTGEADLQTTVGLDDLIKAIKAISINVEGGNSTVNMDTSTIVTAITGLGTTRTANIGDSGLGRDADHPIYMSGGGFPAKSALAAAFDKDTLKDFLTFNATGAVGYSTLAEVKKAVLGYLSSYAAIADLSTAVYNNIQAQVQELADIKAKAWLNATTIVADGSGWKLNVPNNV